MRRLYADISPGLGWDGRDTEALEAATVTQIAPRTATLLAAGVTALAANPRPLAFLVGGATPSHAPANLTITGTDPDDVALTEVVTLRTGSTGARVAGATSGKKVFKTASVTYGAGGGTGGTVAIGFGLLPYTRDIRGRISIEYLLRAVGDRGNPGYLSEWMADSLPLDVAGMIDGKLGAPNANYDLPFAALGDLGRLSLDLYVAELGKMHPTVVVVDHVTIRKDAERELAMIRSGIAGIGAEPPDPAANVGGTVGSIGDNPAYTPPPMFTDSLGDFSY